MRSLLYDMDRNPAAFERDDRVDRRRAPRGNRASNHRRDNQRQRDDRERQDDSLKLKNCSWSLSSGHRSWARATGVANDSEDQGAPISACKCPKVLEGPQRRLRHDIFRVLPVPHQPAGQSIRGIEMGKNDFVRTPTECGALASASLVMWPVWRASELATTDNARTRLVRLPYTCGSRMN
jgi:hypothetical protein